jgi:hypothetical protein
MINNSTNINKANSHLSPQIIKHIKDHDICGGVKPFNGISTPRPHPHPHTHLENWISKGKININNQNRFNSQRPHTITKMNDSINTDSYSFKNSMINI